jgi:Uma2 family endonuclease
MATAPQYRYTVQEYLALERRSDTKHAFFRGEIFAMAGGTVPHAVIAVNVGGELRARLKRGPCRVYSSDMRLKVAATGLYTYPDVMVVCGDPQLADGQEDMIENPKVIVEVLSPSTEDYDRGGKFEHYRAIATLTDYVLVAQDVRRVEHRSRQADGKWRTVEATGSKVIRLESIDCELPLDEIYDKVNLPA